jgi:long-chain acyl-CoA synthetase
MASVYAKRPWLKHYSAFVPAEARIPSKSMIDLFEESALRSPGMPAVYYFDEPISFARLNDLAGRFAALLARWGIGKGDRVALYLQNNPQFLIAQYGAWKRGAIVVPLNPMLKEKEVGYQLRDSGARVLVSLDSLYAERGRRAISQTAVEHVLTTNEIDLLPLELRRSIDQLASSEKVAVEGAVDFIAALKQSAPDDRSRVAVTPDDIAYLVYTSGTTGPPKAAVSLHRNVVYNAEVYRTWMRIRSDDVILGLAPIFHITGLVGAVALAAMADVPLILFHRFDAKEALRLIGKLRPTMSVAAVTAYLALMNHPDSDSADFSSLKKCYSGGAPVAPATAEQFEEKLGVYIHNIYGLTESNSPTHAVPLDKRAPVDPSSGALSIGVPLPGCEAKVVDLEDPRKEIGPGEPGELAVKGPMIFKMYWNKPGETANAFCGGYFLTGDVVVMDKDGWFYVVDRKKDMIVASGFKVWPREVEDVLYQHPAVKEVAVIGLPDAYRGETVKAFVALKDEHLGKVGGAAIISFCKERLADYKYPREVELVAEIPKTASGKMLRRELRAKSKNVEDD